jgi:hypothetical protein
MPIFWFDIHFAPYYIKKLKLVVTNGTTIFIFINVTYQIMLMIDSLNRIVSEIYTNLFNTKFIMV